MLQTFKKPQYIKKAKDVYRYPVIYKRLMNVSTDLYNTNSKTEQNTNSYGPKFNAIWNANNDLYKCQ